jgi:hypothetical protein
MRPPAPGTARYKRLRIKNPGELAACLRKQGGGELPNDTLFEMEFNVQEIGYVGSTLAPFRCDKQNNPHVSLTDGFEITDYIYAHPPSTFGLYNMIGNAAELTATPGIAKGGSFKNSIQDFTLKTDFPYVGPQEWLGFRCACVIKLRHKPTKK